VNYSRKLLIENASNSVAFSAIVSYCTVHSVSRKQEQKDSSLLVIDAADAPDDDQ
jgi:hypothetical protein